MKAICMLSKLQEAVQQTNKVTGRNLSLPILSAILMVVEKGSITLRATNLNVGVELKVTAKVEEEGTFAVDGTVLGNIFSTLNATDNSVTLEKDGTTLRIETGRSKMKIKTLPFDDFPTLPRMESDVVFELPAENMATGFRSVSYAASKSDIKPEISSIYLHHDGKNLVFVSTDGFRLAEKKIVVENLPEFDGVLIPARNMADVMKIVGDIGGDVAIQISDNQISFANEYMYCTSRIINGSFPDYTRIIPTEFTTEITSLKSDVIKTLRQVNIFADKMNQVDIHVDPIEKTCSLLAKNSDLGETKTELECSIDGIDIEMTFNSKNFQDCLQSIPTDSLAVEFTAPNRPMVVTPVGDDTFLYLIMPINRSS